MKTVSALVALVIPALQLSGCGPDSPAAYE